MHFLFAQKLFSRKILIFTQFIFSIFTVIIIYNSFIINWASLVELHLKYKIWKKSDDTSGNHHLSRKNKYIIHPSLKSFTTLVFPASCFPLSTIPSIIRQILIWFLSLEMNLHFPGCYIVKFIHYVFIFLTSFKGPKGFWDLSIVL